MKQKIITGISLVLALILLAGCVPKSIAEVKNEQYVGKTVIVRGTVGVSIKIGTLSGYTVSDSTDNIGVKSSTLPVEGSEITVKGTLMKDSIFGYYILS
jgi:hypothetical protein